MALKSMKPKRGQTRNRRKLNHLTGEALAADLERTRKWVLCKYEPNEFSSVKENKYYAKFLEV